MEEGRKGEAVEHNQGVEPNKKAELGDVMLRLMSEYSVLFTT